MQHRQALPNDEVMVMSCVVSDYVMGSWCLVIRGLLSLLEDCLVYLEDCLVY